MKQDYIMRDLMKKPLPEMPADIRAQLDAGNVTPVPFAEKDHIFKVVDGTPVLISRFWIGETLKLPLIRKAMLNDDTARGMVTHCCIEYRNLAAILPTLYEAYGS